MDKKTFAQFLLISALVLIVWWGLNLLVLSPREPVRPDEPEPPAPPEVVEEPLPEPVEPPEPEPTPEPVPPEPPEDMPEPVEDLELVSGMLRTRWTNVGAALQSLTLLDNRYRAPYKVDDERPPLTLLREFQEDIHSDTLTTITLSGRREGRTWTMDVPTDQVVYEVVEPGPDRLVFQAPVTDPEGHRLLLRKTVTPAEDYHYEVRMEVQNASEEPLEVSFALRGPAGIERETLETRHLGTRVGVEERPGRFDIADRSAGNLATVDDDPNMSTNIRWAGSVNHYFAALVLMDDRGWVDRVESRAVIEDDIVHARGRWDTPRIRRMTDRRETARNGMVVIHMVPEELGPGESLVRSYSVLAVPKEDRILDAYSVGLKDLVEFGFLASLSRLALVLLNGVHRLIPNYGLAIIIMTAVIRLMLHPLTRRSQLSFAKMQKLQPKIAELQKQFGNDKEKLAQAQMELWRKYGVSPLGGCLPMLLQMPVLFALFGTLRAAIQLRHAGFLWIADLSQPDTLFHLPFNIPLLGDQFNLLPIFMAVTMMLNQKYMSPPAATEQAAQQQKLMKWFPLFFVFLLYSFPSGLNLYLTCSTGIGLLERWLIQRKADEIELTPVGAEEGKKKRRSETLAARQKSSQKKKGWLEKLHDLAQQQNQIKKERKRKE